MALDTPTPDTPTGLATRLFGALREANTAAFTALVRFPFQFRDTGSEGECKSGNAQTAEQLGVLLRCLTSDTLLTGDLKEHRHLLTEEIPKKNMPPWTKKWHKEIRADQKLVHVMVPGNGNTFHFIILATAGGVHALWKETTFESN